MGSPPYTWGAHSNVVLDFVVPGITPIYMGSTKSEDWNCMMARDHPHIHGEHLTPKEENMKDKGSPPYTWGALQDVPASELEARITPIYMGSTIARRFVKPFGEDHPHIHGEHCISSD